MHKLIRRLFASTAIAGAALSPQAHAQVSTVIDFEDPSLTGLYFIGDSFSQQGYDFSVGFDFANIDSKMALETFARPSGNDGQFYTQSNEGSLAFRHAQGAAFSLDGFSAAYVPSSADSTPNTVLIAFATLAGGGVDFNLFSLAPKTSGAYPFASYSDPADFSFFASVVQVEFFTCSLVGSSLCSVVVNNGQFAIDDIRLTAAVPEPTVAAMLALGLLGLALRGRRNQR